METLVAQLDRLDQREKLAFITDAYPDLAAPYLAAAGDLTATWYDEQPTFSASTFEAQPADLPPDAQLAANGRWAMLQDSAVTALQGTATRAVFNASRQTVIDNVQRENLALAPRGRRVRWARHAAANACGFCRMLATRGAVYRERALALRAHDHCHCLAVADRDGKYEPPAYVEQWERDYRQARRDGHTDARSIAAAMDPGRHRLPTPTVVQKVKAKVTKPPAYEPQPAGRTVSDLAKLSNPIDRMPQRAAMFANRRFSAAPEYDPPEFGVNCQRTVQAYELRRRGYDVQAQPNRIAENDMELSVHNFGDESFGYFWRDANGQRGRFVFTPTPQKVYDQMAAWGDGARAWVYVDWKGRPSSHIFVAENVGGKIQFLDPQTGVLDSSADLHDAIPDETRLMRVDHLEPIADVTQFVFDDDKYRIRKGVSQ